MSLNGKEAVIAVKDTKIVEQHTTNINNTLKDVKEQVVEIKNCADIELVDTNKKIVEKKPVKEKTKEELEEEERIKKEKEEQERREKEEQERREKEEQETREKEEQERTQNEAKNKDKQIVEDDFKNMMNKFFKEEKEGKMVKKRKTKRK